MSGLWANQAPRKLNRVLLSGLYLGSHKCAINPSVDVPSVPRFKLIDDVRHSVHQEKCQRCLTAREVPVEPLSKGYVFQGQGQFAAALGP